MEMEEEIMSEREGEQVKEEKRGRGVLDNWRTEEWKETVIDCQLSFPVGPYWPKLELQLSSYPLTYLLPPAPICRRNARHPLKKSDRSADGAHD